MEYSSKQASTYFFMQNSFPLQLLQQVAKSAAATMCINYKTIETCEVFSILFLVCSAIGSDRRSDSKTTKK